MLFAFHQQLQISFCVTGSGSWNALKCGWWFWLHIAQNRDVTYQRDFLSRCDAEWNKNGQVEKAVGALWAFSLVCASCEVSASHAA